MVILRKIQAIRYIGYVMKFKVIVNGKLMAFNFTTYSVYIQV